MAKQKDMPPPPEILKKGGAHEKSKKAIRKKERDKLKKGLLEKGLPDE